MTITEFILIGFALLFLFYSGVLVGYLKGKHAGRKQALKDGLGFRPGDHRQWKRGLGNPDKPK